MSQQNRQKRIDKIAARLAARMGVARVVGAANYQATILRRGFFGRLKWALFKK